LRFTRYADDCNIFTKSKMASYRVRDSVKRYLERKLKLKVNMEKTEARRAVGSSFLGFIFRTNGKPGALGYVAPMEKKQAKLENRIRLITRRNRGVAVDTVVKELNSMLRGWVGYYARSAMKSYLEDLMQWTRRRIRQYLWKQWKTGKNRKRRLRQLGVSNRILKDWKLGSNSYWKMAGTMNYLIPVKTIHGHFGLLDAVGYYESLHAKRLAYDHIMLLVRKQGSLFD